MAITIYHNPGCGTSLAHPLLINRPIVVVKVATRVIARLCRPSESVKGLLAETSASA